MSRNLIDNQFVKTVKDIVDHGEEIKARNAVTKRKTNLALTFHQTPLVTVRRTAWKHALREMEWFLSGSSDINDLHKSVHAWWKPWADENGIVKNNYSKQFRSFEGSDGSTDQLQYMIDTLIKDPGSRRNVITMWHTHDMASPDTPITNCHGSIIQAFVNSSTHLELSMYQRSCDMMLGVPHNWIQYWALMHFLAYKTGLKVGSLNWIGGDCHVYPDHVEAVKEMFKVYNENSEGITNKFPIYEIPDLVYNPTSGYFKADDFTLSMQYDPLIKKSLKMTV